MVISAYGIIMSKDFMTLISAQFAQQMEVSLDKIMNFGFGYRNSWMMHIISSSLRMMPASLGLVHGLQQAGFRTSLA